MKNVLKLIAIVMLVLLLIGVIGWISDIAAHWIVHDLLGALGG